MVKLLKSKDFDVKTAKNSFAKSPDLRGSAGIDFFVPSHTKEFEEYWNKENSDGKNATKFPEIIGKDDRGEFFILEPGEDINIPSGYYTWFDTDLALIGFSKSGIATKNKLAVGACVDDADYQGMLHLHMYNYSTSPRKIYFDEKIVQFVPVVIRPGAEMYDERTTSKGKFFDDTTTNRGSGGFGSTGLK